MRIPERILLALSRDPNATAAQSETTIDSIDEALEKLEEKFPNLAELVTGKRVADFGAGPGYQVIALALKYNCTVVGIENNPRFLKLANQYAEEYGVADKVSFIAEITDEMKGEFDIVLSQDAFEHFYDSSIILGLMNELISDTGKILITFGPPWFAPRGCHMQHVSAMPWMNVFFSERTIMNVRSHFRSDGAKRYCEVESGLNQMSLAKCEGILSNSGLNTLKRKYDAVKNINILTKIPVIRELFTNNASVILSRNNLG